LAELFYVLMGEEEAKANKKRNIRSGVRSMARRRHPISPAKPAAGPGAEPERKAPDAATSSAPEPAVEAFAETSAPGKRMAASTVTLRFDERGEPLEAKPETIERARDWLRKSGLTDSELELAPEPPAFLVDEKLTEHILDALAYAQAASVHFFCGHPFDEALRIVRFSAQEQPELVPVATRVLQKHLPEWIAAYEDLAGLLLRFGVVEANKLVQLRKLRNKEAK
jgi:hypothetical protein